MQPISAHMQRQHSQRSAWPIGLAMAVVLGTLLSALSLGGQPLGGVSRVLGATVGGGTGTAVTTPLIAPTTIQAHWSPTMPVRSAQEQQAEARALALSRQQKAPPVGPIHHLTPAEAAAQARTAGPPLPSPKSTPVQAHAAPGAPQADSDFDIASSSPLSGGFCPTHCGQTPIMDTSVGNRGKYLLETGNWFAAKSTNNGSTWSYLDPYTLTGAPSFCCYQQVLYEPSRNRMFWELMYYGGLGSANNQLALYSSAGTDLTSWCGYLLPPTLFGLPSGTWMNLPAIEYSANFLYLSFDDYNASGNFVNSTVARFALTTMANCAPLVAAYVARTDTCCYSLTQGATDTMYWDSNTYTSGSGTGNTVRIFWWPEKSGSYTYQDKAIDPFTYITSVQNCASQDGVVKNWCARLGSYQGTSYRSRAGYRGFGAPLISFAWTAGPTNGISPFPYVVRYYFLLSNVTYEGHDNVYSPNYAVAWPSLAAPTQRGYVGGTFTYGGGTGTGSGAHDYYPANFFLIEDPDTPAQPWSTAYFTGAGNGGSWGDYNIARPWNPDQLHWLAGAWQVGSGTIVPYVAVFGRGRDHNSYLTWSGV